MYSPLNALLRLQPDYSETYQVQLEHVEDSPFENISPCSWIDNNFKYCTSTFVASSPTTTQEMFVDEALNTLSEPWQFQLYITL